MKNATLIIVLLMSFLFSKAQVYYPASPAGESIKPIERQEVFDWDSNLNEWVKNQDNTFTHAADYSSIIKITYHFPQFNNTSSETYEYNDNNQLITMTNATFNASGVAVPYSKTSHRYDSQCVEAPDSTLEYFYNNNSNEWGLIAFQDLSNNANCQTITSIGGTPAFPTATQTYHYYNNINQLITSQKLETNLIWGLDTTETHTYTYDSNGELATKADWGYNIFSAKYEYIRNTNGQLDTTNIYYPSNTFNLPNLGQPIWLLSYRLVYSYNTQGQKAMIERQSKNGNLWDINTRSSYQYDSDGDLIEKIETFKFGNNFINFRKDNYHYSFGVNTKNRNPQAFSCILKNPYIKGTSIQCNQFEQGNTYQVKLYDVLGRIVETQNIQDGHFQLNNINTGFLYILTIEQDGQLLYHQKLIGE